MKLTLTLALLAAAPLASAQVPSWQVEDGTKLVFSDASGVRVSLARPDLATRTPGLSMPKGLVAQGWTPLGPFGGDADDVKASPTNPSVVLVGLAPASSSGTMFRSTDGGVNWSEVPDLAGLDVHELEFAANGTAYAGTIDGIWKSTDDGATWTNLPLGIGLNDQVFEIALDPASPNTIWVGIADALGGQTQNILRSTNGGASWVNRTPPGAAGTSGRGVALDPSDPSKVFAVFGGGFGGGSAWRSNDSGATWTSITSGLPNAPINDVTYTAGKLRVCGGLLFGSQFFGLFESTNDGASWTALHDGTWPSTVINDIESDPANPAILYVGSAGSGVFRSVDGGTTWSFGIGGTGSLSVNEVSVVSTGGAPVFVASSSNAVWLSTDAITFAPSSGGIGALNIEGVAVNPLDASEIAGAFQGLNDGGVYTSTNGGATWTLEPLPGTRFNDAGFGPDGKLVAISDGPTTIAPEGLWRRSTGSWTSIGPDQGPLFESELFTLDFAEGNADHIITGGGDFGVAGAEITLWTTTNGGVTWTKSFEGAPNKDVRDVRFVKDGTNSIAVAAFSDFGAQPQAGGVMRTTNGGATWSLSSAGLSATPQGYGLGLHPVDAQTLYFADRDFSAGGLFKSTDAGASWSPTGVTGLLQEIAVDPLHAGMLFTGGLFTPKVQRSLDDGVTLADFSAGLPGKFNVRDMEVLGGPCTTLLLATSVGIYTETPSCRLEADVLDLSLSAGGTQSFTISGGLAHAGEFYWLIGSASGTAPGLVLDGQTLPLNVDAWMLTTLSFANSAILPNSLGLLDANGEASSAALVVPPASDPALAGITLNHAAALFSVSGFGATVTLATNAQPVTLLP
jgi:hypothetical protein